MAIALYLLSVLVDDGAEITKLLNLALLGTLFPATSLG